MKCWRKRISGLNPSGASRAMNVYTHRAVMDKSVDYYAGIQKSAGVTADLADRRVILPRLLQQMCNIRP